MNTKTMLEKSCGRLLHVDLTSVTPQSVSTCAWNCSRNQTSSTAPHLRFQFSKYLRSFYTYRKDLKDVRKLYLHFLI